MGGAGLFPLLLMASDAAATLADARAALAAERPCVVDPNTTDVTVCGRRHADRFRVPLVTADAGDPAHEGVSAERARLLHRTNPIQELSPFLVGGGLAGVTVTTAAGGTRAGGYRRLAP